MEANKKVSIVIPVYKAADTITRCVESLENNTYKNLQIILVEDCSGDQTIGVCRKLADMYDNVLCVENDQNHGVSNMFRFELSTRKLCWHSNICDPREGDS